jgi:flagellar basal-body rod protein FlgF
MNLGVYQSAASLAALERWQDAVTQNITSAQVAGFKRRTVQIDARQAGEVLINPTSRANEAESRPALFPEVRYGIAFSSGEAQPTRRELDLALTSDGFFTVRMPDGTTGYTRAGQLQVRTDRTLVTSQNLELLNDAGQPMQLSAQGGIVVVDEDGNMRQGDAQIGKVGVVRFTDPTKLIPSAGGLFVAAPGAGAVEPEAPGVLQGHLEASNIQPLQEMVHLVSIARAYEANQKIIQNRDQMLQRTLEMLG